MTSKQQIETIGQFFFREKETLRIFDCILYCTALVQFHSQATSFPSFVDMILTSNNVYMLGPTHY